ncbi:putative protein kinase CMGC-CDKL-Cr family [Helianthus anomalus]
MTVIKYCHDMGVVLRDVKPENILLTTSGKIKLPDFGLAMRITNGTIFFCEVHTSVISAQTCLNLFLTSSLNWLTDNV